MCRYDEGRVDVPHGGGLMCPPLDRGWCACAACASSWRQFKVILYMYCMLLSHMALRVLCRFAPSIPKVWNVLVSRCVTGTRTSEHSSDSVVSWPARERVFTNGKYFTVFSMILLSVSATSSNRICRSHCRTVLIYAEWDVYIKGLIFGSLKWWFCGRKYRFKCTVRALLAGRA